MADLLLSVARRGSAPPRPRSTGCERALMEHDDEKTQLAYAHALAEYTDAGGYDLEVTWDVCTVQGLGVPYDRAKYRELRTLSGGEQKRLVLEYLLAGPDEVLLLDEPDNFLDVPGKVWLEERIRESDKTILFISHDRELLANTATRVVTVELGHAGNLVWTHPGGFARYHEARKDRFLRFEELRRRWDEEHAKLKALDAAAQDKAEYNDGMARIPGRPDPAAQVRGGRPADRAAARAAGQDAAQGRPHRQARGGLRAPRADRADAALRPRGLVRRAGGRARLQRLRQVALPAAARRGRQRPRRRAPTGRRRRVAPVDHTGVAKLGARVRPGWFVQTHEHPELMGRTLLEILHRGDGTATAWGASRPRGCSTATSSRTPASRRFESLSGGQQARFQILMLELSGATLLLLDEPTDNLDVQSRRGARGRARGLRGHGARGDPRPLVRPRLRPVPRVRRRRRRSTSPTAGLGRGPGRAGRAAPLFCARRRVRTPA